MTGREIEELFAAHFDGALDEKGQERLGGLLAADPGQARRFAGLLAIEGALRGRAASRGLSASLVERVMLSVHGPGERRRFTRDVMRSLPVRYAGRVGHRWRFLAPLAAAAALLVALGAWYLAGGEPAGRIAAGDRAGARVSYGALLAAGALPLEIDLADGSTLKASPGSRIAIRAPRSVALEAGEILVSCRPLDGKSFEVFSGDAEICAVGTLFRVRSATEGSVTVKVIEGLVRLSNPAGRVEVAAGQVGESRPGAAPAAFASSLARERNVSTREHPYLFFAAEDLPFIRARAARKEMSPYREAIEKELSSRLASFRPQNLSVSTASFNFSDQQQLESILLFAFHGCIFDDPRSSSLAREGLLAIASRPGADKLAPSQRAAVLWTQSVAYDAIHGLLSEGERESVEAAIAAGAKSLVEQSRSGPIWAARGTRSGDWRVKIFGAIGAAGLVLWDKTPQARGWAAMASDMMKAVLEYEFDGDGGSYETFSRHTLGSMHHALIPTLEALRRVTGEDLFGWNNSVLYRATPFTAHMLYPARDGVPAFGNSEETIAPIGISLVKAASEFDDGLAAWYLERLLADGWRPVGLDAVWGLLWGASVKPEDPDASSRLARAFAYNNDAAAKKADKSTDHATGHVFFRTGFASKDDVYMALAGDMWGFHSHSDKGGYVLAAYGTEFLRDVFDGPQEGPEYLYRQSGEAHQIVLIDGEGQGAGCIGLADAEYGRQKTKVEAFESKDGYDYARFNTARAYEVNPRNSPMRRALRHVVFVRLPERGGYFVVVDDIEKDGSEHEYSHPFHYPDLPPKGVKAALAEGNRVLLSGPGAELHIVAVHPAPDAPDAPPLFRATLHKQYGDAYAKLTCTERMGRFVMMTVLYPVKGAIAPPPFETIKDGERLGVRISGAQITYDKATGKLSVGGTLGTR